MLTCPGADSNLLSIKVSQISDFLCKEHKKVVRWEMCGVVAGAGYALNCLVGFRVNMDGRQEIRAHVTNIAPYDLLQQV
jgi:hypothetical protein